MAPDTPLQIGLIGDHNADIPAHRAIPIALREAARMREVDLIFEWLATDKLTSPSQLARFDGLWCVPGSPYRSMDGALLAIAHARESGLPFLGTCGGFQHAVIEYARHVLGWLDAEHAETSPDAPRAVVSMLACALVDATGPVRFLPGTRIAAAYQADHATEGYRCRYGLNPAFQAQLVAGSLRATAHDESGAIRAVELIDHPFFVATLFQPERAALQDLPCPLARAFVDACLEQAKTSRSNRAGPRLRVRTRHGVDTGVRLNDVQVLVKGLADQDLDHYPGLVPRDSPDSPLA